MRWIEAAVEGRDAEPEYRIKVLQGKIPSRDRGGPNTRVKKRSDGARTSNIKKVMQTDQIAFSFHLKGVISERAQSGKYGSGYPVGCCRKPPIEPLLL
jgi:hypothetical protein